MSVNKKYIKFGLRSDKNLFDLGNSDEGISNLLNDISVNLNEYGQKTGFSLADIEPLIGLRDTGALSSNVVVERDGEVEQGFTKGQSIDLANLSDSKVQFVVSTATELTKLPGLTLNVEPMVIMQDYIDNAKSILGDPPWLNGGDGPVCTFVSSDRINPATIDENITGESSTAAVGSLSNTQIFSTSTSSGYAPLVTGEDFWDAANFEFRNKLHPNLPDRYGLIQWEGYVTNAPAQNWQSTGLFMIEEETYLNSGVYSTLKSVFADTNTISNLSWNAAAASEVFNVTPGDEATRLRLCKYVCIGMTVKQGSTLIGKVVNVDTDISLFQITADSSVTAGTATDLKFSFEIGSQDFISTDLITTFPQRIGDRSKLRYTLWFPVPDSGEYLNKSFKESPESGIINFPYSTFYSTPNIQATTLPYSYKHFYENKGSVLNQRISINRTLKENNESDALRVNNSVHITYTPQYELPKVLSTAAAAESSGTHVLTTKQILIQENTGRLYCSAGWEECSIGDWIAFRINSPSTDYAVSYQIEELSGLYAFVDLTINDQTLLKVDAQNNKPAPILATVFKNAGLVGIFLNDRPMVKVETILQFALGYVLEPGKRYEIITLGNMNNAIWQAVAGTSSGTYTQRSGNTSGTTFTATQQPTNANPTGTVVLISDSIATGSIVSSQSKVDSRIAIGVTAIVEGTSYKIITLGNTTQEQWHAAAGTTSGTDPDYKAGNTFIAALSSPPSDSSPGTVRESIASPPIDLLNRGNTFFSVYPEAVGSNITDGSFVVGTDYKIVSVGSTTDWNIAAGTTGVTYLLGHKFKAETVGGAGNGSARAEATVGIARAEKLNSKAKLRRADNVTVGARYRILSTGIPDGPATVNSEVDQWNTLAGTSSPTTYAVGDVITIDAIIPLSGTLLDLEYNEIYSRTMTLVGNEMDSREITSQNYYENSGSFYDGNALVCLTAVYSATGLEDQSQSIRCAGVFGRQVKAFAEESLTQARITLDSVEGIEPFDTIHHPAFEFPGGKAGKITNVFPVTNMILIGTTPGLAAAGTYPRAPAYPFVTGTLVVGDTVAIVPQSVEIKLDSLAVADTDYQGSLWDCVIPLDTAPPFDGTSDGLATPAGDNLELYNSTLSFSELTLVLAGGNIGDATATSMTDSHFKIKHGSATYKMLILKE